MLDLEVMWFRASWCNPCKQIAPVLEQVKADMPYVKFREVDVELEPDTTEFFGVTGVPTLIVLKNGKPVQRMVGFQPKERIVAMINSAK